MSKSLPPDNSLMPAAVMSAVNAVFGSLGRGLVCLDGGFRVVHCSVELERFLGEGASRSLVGSPAEEILGAQLFGEAGSMRRGLEAGQRREGWGATIVGENGRRQLVSVSGAPLRHQPGAPCDPRVAYVLVVRPSEENEETGSTAPTAFSGLLARSASMLAIFKLIENLEESDATVLLTGESGTGKELLARAIHLHSPRRSGPFLAINCGAIPEQLLESELFGHVRGAFTGAVRDRVGRFEAAVGGTFFLDEVGDLPLALQVKLLRVLQERTFERVGESHSRSTDARIVAASNRNLKEAMLRGGFRDDLYYRLRVVPIEVPPLRERREDIEPLARYLLIRVGHRYDRSLRLSPGAMRALLGYEWPGNVRELENALEYAFAVCQGQTIRVGDLPVEIGRRERSRVGPVESAPGVPPPLTVPAESAPELPPIAPDHERGRIQRALAEHRWRRGETAAALGMSRTTLWRKMREFGLLQ